MGFGLSSESAQFPVGERISPFDIEKNVRLGAENFNERALPISGSGPQFQVMQECVELTRDIGRAAAIGLVQTE
ncbi:MULTISPECIES: hypothetical protein [unclassified Mesorhizobium]|uniref:hypothetical protein n=1 Tax=unclassified Mesorhizobium TaxID=325217 RepID=UPI00120BB10E|nr:MULTISPECIES: hypothetical protein [unclassified Mesorhizobium]TKB17974.1 MAG: hypothetical protein E5V75_10765 [Mesorhizobium sp.]